jgi:Holliday junction resolvase
MSGARDRRKGDRVERELVHLHTDIGIKTERYPLSGASRFRGSGHHLDIYTFVPDQAPLVAEVKARKTGAGLRRDHAEPPCCVAVARLGAIAG